MWDMIVLEKIPLDNHKLILLFAVKIKKLMTRKVFKIYRKLSEDSRWQSNQGNCIKVRKFVRMKKT
jgi:hypothetical protein